MKIKQLMVTTDFSENARKSYSCAAGLSRKFDAELHLVHFAGVAPAVVLGPSSEFFYETRNQALCNEASTHPAFAGLQVTAHLEPHRWTPERFRSVERAQGIDMVVMGTHGRTGLQHFVLGSFAERVVRNSAAPVLVCRRLETQRELALKLIVVPFDFSCVSEAVFPAVQFLSSSFECSFRFVYVYEPVPAKSFPLVKAVRESLSHTPRKPIEDRFAESISSQLSGVDATLETCQGVPSVEIVSRVRELEADLVLVGTHGVLGSVAQNVTREAPCSVLAVPSRASLTETAKGEVRQRRFNKTNSERFWDALAGRDNQE